MSLKSTFGDEDSVYGNSDAKYSLNDVVALLVANACNTAILEIQNDIQNGKF